MAINTSKHQILYPKEFAQIQNPNERSCVYEIYDILGSLPKPLATVLSVVNVCKVAGLSIKVLLSPNPEGFVVGFTNVRKTGQMIYLDVLAFLSAMNGDPTKTKENLKEYIIGSWIGVTPEKMIAEWEVAVMAARYHRSYLASSRAEGQTQPEFDSANPLAQHGFIYSSRTTSNSSPSETTSQNFGPAGLAGPGPWRASCDTCKQRGVKCGPLSPFRRLLNAMLIALNLIILESGSRESFGGKDVHYDDINGQMLVRKLSAILRSKKVWEPSNSNLDVFIKFSHEHHLGLPSKHAIHDALLEYGNLDAHSSDPAPCTQDENTVDKSSDSGGNIDVKQLSEKPAQLPEHQPAYTPSPEQVEVILQIAWDYGNAEVTEHDVREALIKLRDPNEVASMFMNSPVEQNNSGGDKDFQDLREIINGLKFSCSDEDIRAALIKFDGNHQLVCGYLERIALCRPIETDQRDSGSPSTAQQDEESGEESCDEDDEEGGTSSDIASDLEAAPSQPKKSNVSWEELKLKMYDNLKHKYSLEDCGIALSVTGDQEAGYDIEAAQRVITDPEEGYKPVGEAPSANQIIDNSRISRKRLASKVLNDGFGKKRRLSLSYIMNKQDRSSEGDGFVLDGATEWQRQFYPEDDLRATLVFMDDVLRTNIPRSLLYESSPYFQKLYDNFMTSGEDDEVIRLPHIKTEIFDLAFQMLVTKDFAIENASNMDAEEQLNVILSMVLVSLELGFPDPSDQAVKHLTTILFDHNRYALTSRMIILAYRKLPRGNPIQKVFSKVVVQQWIRRDKVRDDDDKNNESVRYPDPDERLTEAEYNGYFGINNRFRYIAEVNSISAFKQDLLGAVGEVHENMLKKVVPGSKGGKKNVKTSFLVDPINGEEWALDGG